MLATTAFAHASIARLNAGATIAAHVHDAPYLSVYLLGRYHERGDDADVVIDAPGAAFHPPGSAHEDDVGAAGLRTLLVQFEPSWLRARIGRLLPQRSTYWTGGSTALAAQRLAVAALDELLVGAQLIEAAAALIARSAALAPAPEPAWLAMLDRVIAEGQPGRPDLSALARRVGVSAPWMMRAYRALRGERIGDRLRRRALEHALMLIEQRGAPLADAALAAGFCDQSHLTRVCRRAIGETPGRLSSATAAIGEGPPHMPGSRPAGGGSSNR